MTSKLASDPRIDPLARRRVAANPERAVWGSAWPPTPRPDLRKPGDSATNSITVNAIAPLILFI